MNWKIKNFYAIMTVENIAVQMFASLTYLLLLHLNYSMTEIGIFLAIFTATTMITEIPSGILVDSIGEKRVLVIAFLLRAIGVFMMSTAQNFILLLITGVLTGVAQSLTSGTLESWIVNEIKQANLDYDIGQLFSKLNIIGPLFGLISGFIGAQLLGKDNPAMAFYVSTVLFALLCLYVLLVQNLFSRKSNTTNVAAIYTLYKETTLNLVEVFKEGRLLAYFILFTIPGILDLGPSNQWQVMLNDVVKEYVIGYYIVGIGITTIFANIFLSRYLLKKQYNMLSLIDKVFMIDIGAIVLMSIQTWLFPYVFIVHVFLVGINGTLIMTYIHDTLIQKDHLRTSIISSFYSMQALASSVLLVLNGILSESIGISNTWVVFAVMSMIVFLRIRHCKFSQKND